MLLHMQALTEAGRGLAYYAAAQIDLARAGAEGAQARLELLTPIVKAWCTDNAVEVASLGVQVHGGMGLHRGNRVRRNTTRDARILPIYEGTNGIQANDLVFRKTQRDGGMAAREFLSEIRGVAEDCKKCDEAQLQAIGTELATAAAVLAAATDWVIIAEPPAAASGAGSYLTLWGIVLGGFVLAKEALYAAELLKTSERDAKLLQVKLRTANYFAAIMLPKAAALAAAVKIGSSLLDE